MEKLIGRMMTWANVTERELAERQEIPTFGETLSWRYLCDVREHPVVARPRRAFCTRGAGRADRHADHYRFAEKERRS